MQRISNGFAVFTAVLATSLSGSPLGQHAAQAAPASQTTGTIPPAPANDPDAQASALMAAAEPFESLTENAFSPDIRKLDDFIGKAKASADGAARLLVPGEAKALSGHVAAIDAARARDDRADLAIAAVEGYRTLVSNSGGQQKVPKQVSLLDYSGFRYQADLKARPIRWSDAVLAVDFADAQWQQISATVSDQRLRTEMSGALTAMRTASQNKDAPAALAASMRELGLVDGLEKFFAHN